MSKSLSSPAGQAQNLEALLQDILDRTLDFFGASKGLIRIFEEATNELVIRAHKGLTEKRLLKLHERRRYGEGRAWECALAGKPLIYQSSPGRSYIKNPAGYAISVPLKSGEKLVGTVNIYSDSRDKFTDRHLKVFSFIGNQLGFALDNAFLYRQSAKRMQALETLQKLAETVTQSLDLEQVLNDALKQVMELFQCHSALIRLVEPKTRELAIAAHKGLDERQLSILIPKRKIMESIASRPMETGEPVIIEDLENDPIYGDRQGFARQIGCRSFASLPLYSRDRTLGTLSIRYREPHAYGAEELQLFKAIGNLIGTAIGNARLYRETMEAGNRFSLVLNSMDALIYVADMETGEVYFINEYGKRIWGDIEGRTCWQALQKDQTGPCSFCTNERLMDEQGNPVGVYAWEFKNTVNQRWYDCRDRAIPWMGGRMARMEIATDITERKLGEEERERLKELLHHAEKMEALGTLAGGVAHDLNNVLGVLVGYSELLSERIPAGSPLRKYAENIMKSGEKGALIIQDLLTLARRGVPTEEVVNLNTLIAGFTDSPFFEKLKVHHYGVTFKSELQKDLLNIKGSPVHLEKTVMNLVANAAEAIGERGEVMIRTENCYLDRAVRGYDEVQEGEYVLLTIRDNGGGIAEKDLAHIFEPFYTKKVMGRSGTGLGLAVVWGTVKDHGGYINVESKEGVGSAFMLYFPVTREEPETLPVKTSIANYMGRGESILVADDVSEQRELAASMLTRLGYEVHTVSGGEAAVDFLKNQKVDLVVLDMIMDPGIDGLETYMRIRSMNDRQRVIIVSGFSETDRVRKAQELGAGQYVKKPYVLERIGLAIRKELDRE